jgi:hypothetical protein
MSKITGLTIVSQPGVKSYFIGTTYNGLLLDKITDNTVETETSFCPMFYGKTKDDQIVFEAINTPMEIEYSTESSP